MVISLKFTAKANHNKMKFKYTKTTKLKFIVILFLKNTQLFIVTSVFIKLYNHYLFFYLVQERS